MDLSRESLAGIHVGDSDSAVRRRLGKALHETKPALGQATGAMEYTLEYPHLKVGMGDGKVTCVEASSPSAYDTSRHVKVGDAASRAVASYGKLDVLDEAHGIVLNFTAKGGRITTIYLGAGPE